MQLQKGLRYGSLRAVYKVQIKLINNSYTRVLWHLSNL